MIDLSEKHGFLKRRSSLFDIGPIGALLDDNLKKEWFYATIVNRDFPVFLNNANFEDTFLYVKDLCLDKFPFGIAETVVDDNPQHNNTNDKDLLEFAQNFPGCKVLKCTTFVPETDSTRFFHQLQRQRRMWWRIFSALPSRYILSDMRSEGVRHQYVEIRATYPWGSQLVETIKLTTINHEAIDKEHLQCKIGHNSVAVHHISNTILAGTMLLNTLCDAYEEPDEKGNGRLMFRFHRKLSPYKVSFALPKGNVSAINEDLIQLSLYLSKQLRANNISSLLLPTSSRNTLESQWNHYDQIGIPYSILINESTLKNGVTQLRSRDTTLKEQVHINELPKYIEQLFKNY